VSSARNEEFVSRLTYLCSIKENYEIRGRALITEDNPRIARLVTQKVKGELDGSSSQQTLFRSFIHEPELENGML
jgi:hypothetical protein